MDTKRFRITRSLTVASRSTDRFMRDSVLVSLLFLAGASPIAFGVDEPNDTLSTATTLELSGLGVIEIVHAVLGDGEWSDRDVDLYSIVIDEAMPLPALFTVTVTADSPELDAYLRLFDTGWGQREFNGVQLEFSDDRNADDVNPNLRTYLLAPGRYFIGVSSASNPQYDQMTAGSGRSGIGGGYTMALIAKPIATENRFEPNDQVLSATPMGSESFVVTGVFIGDGEHGRRDVDIYQLELDGAAKIDVEVRAEGIGSTLDPVVRLRNCEDAITERTYIDGCLLGTGDDSADGSVDASVSVGALGPQTVYIMVSGAGNRRYDPVLSGQGEMGSVGPYELEVTVTYFDRLGPNEPNDSIETAPHVALFVSGRPETVEVDGFLGDGRFAPFQGDRDFYSITLVDYSRMLTVSVDAAAGSDLDAVVAAFDVDGRLLAVNDNHGDSVNARIVLPLGCVPIHEDTVSVYVAVMGAAQRFPSDPFLPRAGETVVEPGQAGNGPGSTGAYKLTLSVEPEEPGCAVEPNDTLATATNTLLVDEGAYVCTSGEIGDGACDDPYQDLDLWSFELTRAPARLEVSVSSCQDYGLTYHSNYLFDSTGTLLALRNGLDPWTDKPIPLRAALDEPGIYYVGVSGEAYEHPDLTVPCSVQTYDYGPYDLTISLAQGRTAPGPGGGAGAAAIGETTTPSPLFATRLDDGSNMIDALHPDSGEIISSFAAPEPRFGGSEGLAPGGILPRYPDEDSSLYYMGVGRFPKLYQLDPATGEVFDDFILWSGSGYYGDITILGQEVYVLDVVDASIHVVDPAARRLLRTLPVGNTNGITVGGGLAALSYPDRLYVSDGFNTRAIYEVDPQSGVVTNVVSPPRSDCCIPGGNGTPGCDDAECMELVCSESPWCCDSKYGMYWEPVCSAKAIDRCEVCKQTSDITTRPTALGAIGPLRLYMADWQSQTAELIERSGEAIGPMSLAHPIGSFGGNSTADPFNRADLVDWIACMTGPDRGPYTDGCQAFDFDLDLDVDLDDLVWFQIVFGRR